MCVSTHTDYAEAIKSLPLVDLYREEQRYLREIEMLDHYPRQMSAGQIQVRNDRLSILEQEINTRYAKGGT